MAEQNVNNAKKQKQFFLCSKKPITKAFDGTTYALGGETGVDFFPNLVGIVGENEAARVESTAAAF